MVNQGSSWPGQGPGTNNTLDRAQSSLPQGLEPMSLSLLFYILFLIWNTFNVHSINQIAIKLTAQIRRYYYNKTWPHTVAITNTQRYTVQQTTFPASQHSCIIHTRPFEACTSKDLKNISLFITIFYRMLVLLELDWTKDLKKRVSR